ncbi:MAG: hypothetical protein ABIL18_01950, partial [candidate division WOR-3 bacterium]
MDTYYLLGKISPKLRNFVTIILFFTGFALQLSSRNILPGLPFVAFCVLLNWIKGFSMKPIRPQKLEWTEVTPEKIAMVGRHCEGLKRIPKNLGCAAFIIITFFVIFGIGFIWEFLLNLSKHQFPLFVLIIDSIIIFSGVMLSGGRDIWIPNNLDVKIPIIERILDHPVLKKDPNLQIIPYLEIGKTKDGTFPNDTRILIKFKDAPQDFIGLQFQISINDVQGKKYPYCYCVIIARKSFGLFAKFKPFELERITIETETSSDADVIIIRQTTTKSSGYYTNEATQDYILSSSINIVKKLILR